MSHSTFQEEHFSTKINTKTVLRIISQALPYWILLTGFIFFISLTSASEAFATFIMRTIIDEGIRHGNVPTLVINLIIYALAHLVIAGSVFGFIYCAGRLSEQIQYDLRQKLFNHIQELIGALTPAERRLITLNCVVQSQNFRELVPLAKLASSWGVAMNYSPYTWMRTDDREYVVSGEELEELRTIISELLNFKRQHNTVKTGARFLHEIVTFFEDGSIPGCRAGERFLVVNPDGTLSPCGLIPGDYTTLRPLQKEFSKNNDCTACNTCIRAWNEWPIYIFFSQ